MTSQNASLHFVNHAEPCSTMNFLTPPPPAPAMCGKYKEGEGELSNAQLSCSCALPTKPLISLVSECLNLKQRT